ncbi:MAG: hypothetical protein J6V26_02195 [Alistipes sp.]|nr:hypothetical protein [Alistipes sp.]
MKKIFTLAGLLFALCVVGCTYDDSAIIDRIERLENDSKIASIQQQIDAINASLIEMKGVNSEIKGYITVFQDAVEDIEASQSDIEELKSIISTLTAKDKQLVASIEELEEYVNEELQNTKDWATATFATLEQYNALAELVAELDEYIKTIEEEIDGKISTSIADLEASMKQWVNEQLTGYYTIAEVDAALKLLEESITAVEGDFQTEIETLSNRIDTLEEDITTAYTTAITEAITSNNGIIDTKIADEIDSVNSRIDSEIATINAKIVALESRLIKVENDIEYLLSRVQSVSYVPTHSDGKATLKYSGDNGYLDLDFEISPKEVLPTLAEVWQYAVTVKAVVTETRAVEFISLPVKSFEVDSANGIASLRVECDNLLSLGLADNQGVSVAMSISDGNTSVVSAYIPVVFEESDDIEEDLEDDQPAPILSFYAPEVTLDAAAYTNSRLIYKLQNPVDGGVLTAESKVNWITNIKDNDGYITFAVAENEGEERTGKITATYTTDKHEVKATATIIQSKADINETVEYETFTITEVHANASSSDTWNLILFENDPILGEVYTRITVKLPKANAQYITDGAYSVAAGTIIPNTSGDAMYNSYYRFNTVSTGGAITDATLTIAIDKENKTAQFSGSFIAERKITVDNEVTIEKKALTFEWDGAVDGFVYQDIDAGITEWDYFYIYSHWDDTKYVVGYSDKIRFDWYLKKLGGKKSDPVAAGTYVVSEWESTTTKDYVDASATKINGVLLQTGGVVTINEVAEGLEFTFDVTDVNGTNWKGTYVGPIDPNLYYNPYAN